MTTSGATNWELDIADVIEESFERIGIELRTSHQAKSARRSLNLLLQDLGNSRDFCNDGARYYGLCIKRRSVRHRDSCSP